MELRETFVPGFGVTIGDAVQASCSAYPFFERKTVTTAMGDHVELIDGGYCANNPTLYAIADALIALKTPRQNIRTVSVGVGVYPGPKPGMKMWLAKKYIVSVQLLQKTLEINTQSSRRNLWERQGSSTVPPPLVTVAGLGHDNSSFGNAASVAFLRQPPPFSARRALVMPKLRWSE
jgi:hypothetical protein